MKRDKLKLKILYIISIILILSIVFSNNSAYNIMELRFLVSVIIAAMGIGVIGVYLFGKDMKLYKNFHFISYVMTAGFTFVPVIGVYSYDGTRSYGFPAQWFNYVYEFEFVNFHLTGFYLIISYFIGFFVY